MQYDHQPRDLGRYGEQNVHFFLDFKTVSISKYNSERNLVMLLGIGSCPQSALNQPPPLRLTLRSRLAQAVDSRVCRLATTHVSARSIRHNSHAGQENTLSTSAPHAIWSTLPSVADAIVYSARSTVFDGVIHCLGCEIFYLSWANKRYI